MRRPDFKRIGVVTTLGILLLVGAGRVAEAGYNKYAQIKDRTEDKDVKDRIDEHRSDIQAEVDKEQAQVLKDLRKEPLDQINKSLKKWGVETSYATVGDDTRDKMEAYLYDLYSQREKAATPEEKEKITIQIQDFEKDLHRMGLFVSKKHIYPEM